MEITFNEVNYNDFHDLSFKINNDKIVGITGSGKSILLKIIACNIHIKGKILYDDEKLSNTNINHIRKKISLIEQEFNTQLFIDNVKEHMEFIIKYYKLIIKDPEKKMIDSLKIVGLSEKYLNRKINTLSKSELKLIQIAVALLSNPEVLLFDEPLIGLDKKNEKKIIMLINKLKDNYHKTIVFATTNSETLYKYTDELILLKNNTIFLTGNTKEIYKRVDYLSKNNFEIPDIVLFTYKAKKEKKIHIDYHRDVRDLIKDIYKHV